MNQTYFSCRLDETGCFLQLRETYRQMLRKRSRILPVTDWADRAPADALSVVSAIQDALDNEPLDDLDSVIGVMAPTSVTRESNQTLQLSHDFVASLSDRQAKVLELPPPVPFILRVDRNGALTDVKTMLSSQWTQTDGRRVSPTVTGSVMHSGTKVYRLPETLYRTVMAIDSFNAESSADINVRLAHLAHLKDVTGDTDDVVRFEQRLKNIKLSHAHSFSIDFSGDESSLGFAPVLHGATDQFGRRTPLLNSSEQKKFAGMSFGRAAKALASYFIDNDHFLFVHPSLLPALSVVRQVQDANKETKAEFLRSPAGFIRKTLEDQGEINPDTSYAIDQLFVETDEYSERVTGIGLWEGEDNREPDVSGVEWFPDVEVEEQDEQDPEDVRLPDEPDDEELGPSRYMPNVSNNVEVVDFEAGDASRADKVDDPSIPAGMRSTLRAHQVEGLVWLQMCWQDQRRGAILADDMGVGKTIQSIAFMRWLQENYLTQEHGPLMIVAPVSLLDNWQNEIDIHLDQQGLGKSALLYGDGLKRYRATGQKDILAGKSTLDVDRLRELDLLLTTYETMRDYSISFGRIPLTCLVFDEMQKVKNPASLMTRASKSMNAQFTLGLTGTPIENTVADLWCMLDTVVPGSFGARSDFLARYGAGVSDEILLQLGNTLMAPADGSPAYMLRRLKTEIGEELPPKNQSVLPIDMPPGQQRQYDAILRSSARNTRSGVLLTLQKLRSLSLHPDGGEDTRSGTDEAYIAQSGRMQAAFQALDSIARAKEKALVFVESLDVAAQIALLIRRRYKLRHTPARIYGATPAFRRQQIVNTFTDKRCGEFDVLVLSPKAAGVGLNIVAANHVIHLTRWWNPAVEDQCTDRVYRIKQDKPVTVYIPQSVHPSYPDQSFDVVLHQLLEKKRAVAKGVLLPGETGNEAAEMLKQLAATIANNEPVQSEMATVEARSKSAVEQSASVEFTLFPTQLTELLETGFPEPEVGYDVEREDGAIFTNLEWAWLAAKVGFAELPPEDELQQLKRMGWRVVDRVDEYGMQQLRDWMS